MRLTDFDDWARAHHGIITLDGSGLSRAAWSRSLDAGTIIEVHPGVACLPGTPDTAERRIVAGVLAVGEPALASHRSAALLWGIARPDTDPVEVIAHDGRLDLRLDGVEIHRPPDRRRVQAQRRFGIACTDVLRTLLDLGAVEPAAVSDAVGHIVTSRLATLDAIETAVAEQPRDGRSSIAAVRDAVDDWSVDAKPSGPLLEATMRRLVTQQCLPPVEFRPVVEGYEVDARVIDTPVVIDCDGWTSHRVERTNAGRNRGRTAGRTTDRTSVLTAAGWIVLRFTFRTITTRPRWTATRIIEAVDRWHPAHTAIHATPPPPDAA